jgi:polysaccharide export outer membrane protein
MMTRHTTLGLAATFAAAMFIAGANAFAQAAPQGTTQPLAPKAAPAAGPATKQAPSKPATSKQAPKPATSTAKTVAAPAPQAPPPPDYVIGADDILVINFRREPDMSGEVVVRPDGKITLRLLNDIQAAGLTPDKLRDAITAAAVKFVEDPTVTVLVKQINSRRVFITGQVSKPGAYPLGDRMTVLQLIAMAGGLTDYAKPKEIVLLRDAPPAEPGKPRGRQQTFKINYEAVMKLKNLTSNIELRSGDTVIVP